jgi:electron transfer flavoprotein beta subunit
LERVLRIVTCYKSVPDEQDIGTTTARTLDFSKAAWKIGQYDLNAVEAAMELACDPDDEVFALTTASEALVESTKLRKAILSRGPAEMYGVISGADNTADSLATANLLKAGVDRIGDVDLVICGEGSGDIYAQQVGCALGFLLGLPTINSVNSVSREGNVLTLERNLENGIEVLQVDLPALICVTTEINTPRIPGMKDILGAGKKQCTTLITRELDTDVLSRTEIISCLAPEEADRLGIVLEGDSDENIDTLFSYLQKMV